MPNNNIVGVALDEVYRWFDFLNKKYFNNELEVPVITIQKGRSNNLGWFTLVKVWTPLENSQDKSINPEKYEINITAENLYRPVEEIVGTLQHEMVHYYNCCHATKDCNGQIHNKKFREMAEAKGLLCEKSKQYGWGLTTLSEPFKKIIADEIKPDAAVFEYFRNQPKIEKDKKIAKKTFKYKCPSCGTEVKGKADIKVRCVDCDCDFELEED